MGKPIYVSRALALVLLPALAAGWGGSALRDDLEPVPAAYALGFESIREQDVREVLGTLAGPDFPGRDPATDNFTRAAQWAADWLKSNGIAGGMPDGSYFQRFTVQSHTAIPATARFTSADGAVSLLWGTDFTLRSQTDVDSRIKLAFVRPRAEGDLAKIDEDILRGRVVILHPTAVTIDRAGVTALLRAQADGSLGAHGVLTPDARMRTNQAFRSRSVKGIPLAPAGVAPGLRMTEAAATHLATYSGARGYTSSEESATIVETPPNDFRLAVRIAIEDEFHTANVIAKISGTDPALKAETVMLGAHLDHLGQSQQGTHWGADDNASGSTAALMIARALAVNGSKPRRTVLVALWSCEEIGLFGSLHYVKSPVVPLAKTVAYINMDMLGRDSHYSPWGDLPQHNTNAVYASTVKLNSPDFYALLHRMNRHTGLNLRDDKEDRTFRSDTKNFVESGVPTLKAFTGEHPDYHRPTDTPEKINYPKLATIARWLYLSAQELANQDGRPAFVAGARYVTGRVLTDSTAPLPPGAAVIVVLAEIGKDGKQTRVLDRTVQRDPGQLPCFFGLRYEPGTLGAGSSYVVWAEVVLGEDVLWESAEPVPVLVEGRPSAGVAVSVVPGQAALRYAS